METFCLKLAVAVIPLIFLVASVIFTSGISTCCAHYPLSWHRKRRHILRAMAAGVMLR